MGVDEIISVVLKVSGAVAIVGSAIAILWKWIRPAIQLSAKVAELEKCVKQDYEEITDIKNLLAVLCRCQIVMIDSQISGDNIEALQQAKSEMIDTLAEFRTK